MIYKIKKVLRKILNKLTHIVKRRNEDNLRRLLDAQINKIEKCLKESNNIIFVFGSPYHSNLGDQAQSYCIDLWLKKHYKNFKRFIIDSKTLSSNNYKLLNYIADTIRHNDIVFLHSGYHLTSLYPLENDLIIKTLCFFKNNKIIIFPQTIYYSETYDLKEVTTAFNNNRNVLLLCRDQESYDKSKELFTNTQTLLFPDIVTSMIGNFHSTAKRKNGVLFCIRNDKEAYYSKEEIKKLMSKIKENNVVKLSDTSINKHPYYVIKNRQKILNKQWRFFSKFKLTITDRYHGTIFSLIGNTPVIVLGTTDHKLKSGIKWFPESFNKHVYFAKNLNEAYLIANNILKTNYSQLKLTNYFQTEYFDKLKGIIDETN